MHFNKCETTLTNKTQNISNTRKFPLCPFAFCRDSPSISLLSPISFHPWPQPSNHWYTFYHYILVFLVIELYLWNHTTWTLLYLSSSTLHNILRFTHDVLCITSYFHYWGIFHYMVDDGLFINSPEFPPPPSFLLLWIKPLWIVLYTSFCGHMLSFLEWLFRSRIDESYSRCMFNFIRNN